MGRRHLRPRRQRRLTGRPQRHAPELVLVLIHEGMRILTHDERLAPRARKDIEAASEAGRFDVPNPRLALMAAGGALLGLLQLLEENPDLDAGERSDAMTRQVLRVFGKSPAEAAELVVRELPPQPDHLRDTSAGWVGAGKARRIRTGSI